MSTLLLHNQFHPDTTSISNYFIDRYMPSANGSFVKVYLYLLRHSLVRNGLSIAIIADELDETEKDIKRALRYWTEQQLLSIQSDEEEQITGITILDIKEDFHTPPLAAFEEPVATYIPVADTKVVPKEDSPSKLKEPSVSANLEGGMPEATKLLAKPSYSDAQIGILTEMEDVKWMMSALEQYLERMLKPSDIQLVLYLYEGIGFSTELILYLYEYCVSMNKKNPSYIEAVALNWAESGIDTAEKAEASTYVYNTGYQTVTKAFGLNRTLSEIEKKFITRWFEHYRFDASIIQEACGRTILATGKPDFKYTDKILENWNKKNVRGIQDIKRLDEEHQRRAEASPKNTHQPTPSPSSGNKFNAFPQRQHDKEYYNTLEKRMLEKTLQQNKGRS